MFQTLGHPDPHIRRNQRRALEIYAPLARQPTPEENARLAKLVEAAASIIARHRNDECRSHVEFNQGKALAEYRMLFDSIDEGFCTFDMIFDEQGQAVDYRFVEYNAAFERHTGLTDAVGRTIREILPDQDLQWFELYGRVAETGEPIRVVRYGVALKRWFEIYAFRIGEPSQRRIAALFSDVTARKQAEIALQTREELQAFLLMLSDQIRPIGDPALVKATAARLLGQQLKANRTFYADADDGRWSIINSYEHGVAPLPDVAFPMADYGAWIVDEFRAGRRLIVKDIAADTRFSKLERAAHQALEIGAFVAIPLVKNSSLVALLVVQCSGACEWSQRDIAMIEETAERTWAAVEHAKAAADLHASEGILIGQKEALQAAVDGASLAESLAILSRTAEQQFGSGVRCGFYLVDHQVGELRHIVGMGEEFAKAIAGCKIGPDEVGCGLAVYSNRPVITADVYTSPRWESSRWLAERFEFRGIWSFPLPTTRGKVVGTLALLFTNPREATPKTVEIAVRLGRAAGIIIARAQELEERNRVEEALRQSEARYRTIAANLPNGAAFVVDRDLRYQLAGGEALALAGFTPADFEGKTIWESLPAETAADYEHRYRLGLAGHAFRSEHDSHGRHYLTHGVPMRDESGEVEAVLALSYDITERRRSEAALRESEERFRQMADRAPVMVWVTECDGECSYLNKPWYEFTGQTPATGLGWGWLDAVHPEDRDRANDIFVEAGRKQVDFRMEYRLRGKDGQYRWVIDAAVPRVGADGQFHGFIGSVIDITERKKAEDALQDADRRKDEFLATLAHELRNPLAPIRNSLHILRMAGGVEVTVNNVYDIMERQIDQMIRMVDDLMEVSRITRGKIELRKERVELAAIIRSAVETSRPLIEAGKHQLTIAISEDPIMLDADPIRIAQVFANLLNNAAKYTEDGGQICISAKCEESIAVISVRDSGLGIPKDMLPKIFDLFIQADRTYSRAQGGLGIGLTLVRNLVLMHDGTVEANSLGLQQGSEFIVRLPIAADASLGQETVPLRQRAQMQLRILVVDDNRDAGNSLGMLLKLLGAEVQVVHNGHTAVTMVQEYRPRVILLDIGMPDLDGFEVAKLIRETPQGQDAVLIALTGWGQDEDRRRSQAAGFDHHLIKPVDLAALQDLLVPVQA